MAIMDTRFVFRTLGLMAVVASCIAATLSIYRREMFVVDVRVASGANTSGPRMSADCKRTLRVVNVSADDFLNLRERASYTARIRHRIAPGSSGLVDLGERQGAWKRIEFRGEVGYVHMDFVREDDVPCAAQLEGISSIARHQDRSVR
jgi:hypothetical protein